MQHDPLGAAARRSQWILDIERDLRLITTRLHTIEDHFEDDGVITQLTEAVHQLAVQVEALHARQVGDSAL